MISLCALTTFGQLLMYMSPFQNSRSAFVGSRQPMTQQAIFRPQPAFFQPEPMVRNHRARADFIPSASAPTQFGQLQGSSGPNPPSLQEVLAGRGFTMPEKPTGAAHQAQVGFKDPVTGKMVVGGAHDASHASLLSDFYGQNPEALEIAKQYQADPFQFGGKPSPTGSLGGQLIQTIQPPTQAKPAPEQELRDQRGAQIQEMQAMMREMMQMISALSNRGGFGGGYGGGFGGGYGGGFGGYSPRQQMMFGGIGSIPMSRGMFY
jgi:hypothetical protein